MYRRLSDLLRFVLFDGEREVFIYCRDALQKPSLIKVLQATLPGKTLWESLGEPRIAVMGEEGKPVASQKKSYEFKGVAGSGRRSESDSAWGAKSMRKTKMATPT